MAKNTFSIIYSLALKRDIRYSCSIRHFTCFSPIFYACVLWKETVSYYTPILPNAGLLVILLIVEVAFFPPNSCFNC